MKILIIGEKNINSLETIYKKNFKFLKCKHVNIIPFWKPKNFFLKKLNNFNEKYFYIFFCYLQNFFLKIYLSKDSNIYDIIIIFNGYHLNKEIITFLKTKKKKSLINIQSDNIFEKKNILKNNIKYFDKIYVWSSDLKKKIEKNYKIESNKIFILRFAYDQFLLNRRSIKKINDKILFYGSWDKEREKILSKIDSKIIKIYGNGWDKAQKIFREKYYIKNEILGKRLVKEILSSLVCINLLRPQAKNYINMRTFEVIGYGGRLLSKLSKEQNSFFINFKNIIYFKNIKDIKNIYNSLIFNKSKLLKISLKNRKKIINENYLNRAKKLLDNEKL